MLPFELIKDTPYLALSGELWSVFYEYFNRNWSCYRGFLLYHIRKYQDYVHVKGEQQSTMQKLKHYLRHENKVNENKVFHCKAQKYILYIIENNEESCSPLCQTYKPTIISKQISPKWTNIQEASVSSTTPNAARTISCKAWNSLTNIVVENLTSHKWVPR